MTTPIVKILLTHNGISTATTAWANSWSASNVDDRSSGTALKLPTVQNKVTVILRNVSPEWAGYQKDDDDRKNITCSSANENGVSFSLELQNDTDKCVLKLFKDGKVTKNPFATLTLTKASPQPQ